MFFAVCVHVCRCDEESVQISEGVEAIKRELENQQQICQTLQSELQDLEIETAQCQLNKTQVRMHTSVRMDGVCFLVHS